MKNQSKIHLFISLILFSGLLFAESDQFVKITFGGGYGHLRDFGTSPLTYNGPLGDAKMGYYYENDDFQLTLQGGYIMGIYGVYKDNTLYTMTHMIPEFHGEGFFQLPIMENTKLKAYAGLSMNNTTNIISNSSLFNNSFAISNISTLFLGGKLQQNIHNPERHKKFIVKYTIPEFDSRISLGLNLGILNLNLRPGYPYMIHFSDLNSNYIEEYNIFLGGFRMRSQLAYIVYTKNGNGLELKYLWDAYSTGKKDEHLLNVGMHSFQFSFLFKTN